MTPLLLPRYPNGVIAEICAHPPRSVDDVEGLVCIPEGGGLLRVEGNVCICRHKR